MKLAYICTNYNNSADTIAATNSLRSGDGTDCLVIVVDNDSTPDQRKVLRELALKDANVVLIENKSNVGYFRGLNCGLKELYAHHPETDVAVIGNNDLLFPSDFVQQVSQIKDVLLVHPVVAPCIVTKDGEHQNPHVLDGVSFFREVVYDLYYANYGAALVIRYLSTRLAGLARRGDEDQHQDAREIEQGHGSCYLLGQRFFEDYRQFWAPTFLFGEEYFLSLQLARRGDRTYFDPRVKVTHAWHSSINSLPNRRHWELAREAHRVYRRHNPIWSRNR